MGFPVRGAGSREVTALGLSKDRWRGVEQGLAGGRFGAELFLEFFDAFGRGAHAGAEFLGMDRDAKFFDHPAVLQESAVGVPMEFVFGDGELVFEFRDSF